MIEVDMKVKQINDVDPNHLSQDLLCATEPLVLKGLVAHWPMVKQAAKSSRHAIDYLRQFDGGKALTAMLGAPSIDGRIFYSEDCTSFNIDYRRLLLDEVFDKLEQFQSEELAPMIYVGSTNIDNWLPGFRAENDINLHAQAPLVSLWIGNQSRVAAHYDFPTNIACSVAGHRRFTLFPPEQLENLYVGPVDFTPAGQPISMVDFAQPDYAKFPRFKDALRHAQVADLEPGDAILVPSMWWHHVEALDSVNVLVNYWWRNTPSYMGPPLSVLQHAMIGLRDLPDEQRAVWKNLFDHYVFDPKQEHFEHIPEAARGALNPMDEDIARKIRGVIVDKLR
jgi:hypothetical protein